MSIDGFSSPEMQAAFERVLKQHAEALEQLAAYDGVVTDSDGGQD